MKKTDLKSGMYVETRNGNQYMVVGDRLMREQSFIPLCVYGDDLLVINRDAEQLDIVKVFDDNDTINFNCLDLIWERLEDAEPSFKVGDVLKDEDDSIMLVWRIGKEYMTGYPLYYVFIVAENGNIVYMDEYLEEDMVGVQRIDTCETCSRAINAIIEGLGKYGEIQA